MTTFGTLPPSKSNAGFDLGLSDDRKAFTLRFADLKVAVGKQPTATALFSLVIPLEGERRGTEIEFTVQGFALTTEAATAALLFSVSGQSTVVDLPANTDKSLTESLKFVADAASECRLCLFMVAGRDASNAEAEAVVTLSSVDAEVRSRAKAR